MDPNLFLDAIDRLATAVVGALQRLFGFQYSKNTETYTYQVVKTTTSANESSLETLLASFNVTQEADFICTKTTALSRIKTSGTATDVGQVIGTSTNDGAAGDPADAPFTVLVTDGSTDRQLMNQAVDALAWAGQTGGLPGVWSKARLFARNSTIQVQMALLKLCASGVTWDCKVLFHGFKVYDLDALNLTDRRS